MVTVILRILMAASLLGAFTALLALLLAAVGVGILPFWHAAIGVTAAILTFVGIMVLQLNLQTRFGSRVIKDILKAACPKWMKWLANGSSLIGGALWFGLGFVDYQPPPGGMSSLMSGAFGLMLFPLGFLVLYSYAQKRQALARTCTQGHRIPFAARFCPECGEAVPPDA